MLISFWTHPLRLVRGLRVIKVKQRLGSVLAWVGFACFLFGSLPLAVLTTGSIWETEIFEQPEVKTMSCSDAKEQRGDNWLLFATMGFSDFEPDFCSSTDWVGSATFGGEEYLFYGSSSEIQSRTVLAKLAVLDVGYSDPRFWVDRELYNLWALLAGVWLPLVIIRYILLGSAPLLPWKKG